jgi:hypothetical protein
MKNLARVLVLLLWAALGSTNVFAQKCKPVSNPPTPDKLAASVNCLVEAQSHGQVYVDVLVLKKGETKTTPPAKPYSAVLFVVAGKVEDTGQSAGVVVAPGGTGRISNTTGGHSECGVSATTTTVNLECRPNAEADTTVYVIYHP